MDCAEEDFFNLKFNDLRDELRHDREQRDEFLDHTYSIDRRLRAIERCCQEYFGIDPTSLSLPEEESEDGAEAGAESIAEGQADVVEGIVAPQAGSWLANHETQEAVMLELIRVYYNCTEEDAKGVIDTTPRYDAWTRLTNFVIEHAGIHG